MSFILNTDIYNFLKEPRENLGNVEFLENFIKTKIGIELNAKKLNVKEEIVKNFFGGMCSKQSPSELAGFMAHLFTISDKIDSYMEIGCEKGGTFFLLDSYLRALNVNYMHSQAIDVYNIIKRYRYREYNFLFPSSVYRTANSSNYAVDKNYSLILIDGHHGYDFVKSDFEKYSKFCKYVAFHDINYYVPGRVEVKRFWDEIKVNYKYWEFLNKILISSSRNRVTGIIKMKSNIFNLPCSIGEAIDRYIIMSIKYDNIKDKNMSEKIKKEKDILESRIIDFSEKSIKEIKELTLYNDLKKENQRLWDLEDKIRLSIKSNDIVEIANFAKDICKSNDSRSSIKRCINQFFGSPFEEIKKYAK